MEINNKRQERVLRELLKGPIAVKDLGPIAGALNVRQVVMELRQQGFQRIIYTRRLTVIDRDGKVCHPGEYYIPLEHKLIVQKTLREYASQARTRRPGDIDFLDDFPFDSSKGGKQNARPQC